MAKLRASREALSAFVLTVGKSGNSLIDGEHFTWEISRQIVHLPTDERECPTSRLYISHEIEQIGKHKPTYHYQSSLRGSIHGLAVMLPAELCAPPEGELEQIQFLLGPVSVQTTNATLPVSSAFAMR
jgi:hypothetical protein